MEMLQHARFHITTARAVEFIDLTARLEGLVAEARVETGFLNLQTLHTTTAIVVNEHEPGLLADFEAHLDALAPECRDYAHDDLSARVNVTDGERRNGHAHCRALLLPCSVSLNVAGGRLMLGRWQRVFLVELDGPRDRAVSVLVLGEAAR